MVRIDVTTTRALDEWAKEDGVSRNSLVSRELATLVTRRKKTS